MSESLARFSYTDPLAASWMARHFGMLFAERTGLSVSANPGMWYMAERHYQVGRLYVHPDSLRLLIPQNAQSHCGDVGILHVPDNNAHPHLIASYANGNWMIQGWKEAPAGYVLLRIIERNGVAFMWPEKEADDANR